MSKTKFLILFVVFIVPRMIVCGQSNRPAAYGPVPSANQLRWQQMEYYAFIHFSVNTYTDISWGLAMKTRKYLIPLNLIVCSGAHLQRSRNERRNTHRQTSQRFLFMAVCLH